VSTDQEVFVLATVLRAPVLALLMVSVAPVQATLTDLTIIDSKATNVAVHGAAIDYGGLLSLDRETQGIRVMQGDGLVLLKWSDVDTLKVTKIDDSSKPPRIELEVVLRNRKKVPATMLRAGRMQLVGKTDLGDYKIDLDKIRAIVPIR
jgi:hypothetical protein